MPPKSKKDKEVKERIGDVVEIRDSDADANLSITTKDELKSFLVTLRDKMTEQTAAPIYAISALNYVLNLPSIYTLLDNETKEIARDIWLRLKQSGAHLRNPPLLFGDDEDGLSA